MNTIPAFKECSLGVKTVMKRDPYDTFEEVV